MFELLKTKAERTVFNLQVGINVSNEHVVSMFKAKLKEVAF
jgi:hypothetical protein